MPDGLETRIGTRGVRLSGGQKQRAAAARMLLRQPELLVVDDLSSALDVATEQRLWEQLFAANAWEHRSASGSVSAPVSAPHPRLYSPSCLAVSHRPYVLEQADWVILLAAGTIAFSGPAVEFRRTFPNRFPEGGH